jgi:Rad51
LRLTLNPQPKDILGFQQLDKLLELFRYHQGSSPPRQPGWTFTSRAGYSVSDEEADDFDDDLPGTRADRSSTKRRPPIIEVSSLKSASGKTTLLYYLSALALLQNEYGGKESTVIWIDTDNTFSASRLVQIMSTVVSSSKHNPKPPSHTESIVTTALQHLSIIKSMSSTSLLDTLHALSRHLLQKRSLSSPNRPLGLLVLDSATAFYHQDRFDADIARLEAGPNPDKPTRNNPSRTLRIISALKNIQSEFECTILFTTVHPPQTTSLYHPQRPRDTAANRDTPVIPSETQSIPPWTSFATLSLTGSRIPIPQFSPSMTLEDCLRDKDSRQEAVSKGRFGVGVNWEGAEGWPAGVRDAMKEMRGRGSFVVRIDEWGMGME